MGYIGVILLLSLGGFIGTSLIAERSNPGDTLYNMKTGFNQDVKESLAIGSFAEGKLQLDLIEDRINEKLNLISKNSLTAEVNNKINIKIDESIQKYLSIREKIQTSNKIEDYQILEARFEGLMAQNQDIENNSEFDTFTGSEVEIDTGITSTGIIEDILDTTDINIDLNPFDSNTGSEDNTGETTQTGNTDTNTGSQSETGSINSTGSNNTGTIDNTGAENNTGSNESNNSSYIRSKVISEKDGYIKVISSTS